MTEPHGTSSALFTAVDQQIDDVAAWVDRHPATWPPYGKLWAWCVEHNCTPKPEDPRDRELFTALHDAVAARIVTRSLADAGWTFEQLTLTDHHPMKAAA